MKIKAFKNDIQISDQLKDDKDIVAMRAPFTKAWLDTYNKGFQAYVQGRWSEAKEAFEEVLRGRESDKPTKNLMEFMAETNFQPPPNWRGFKVTRAE